MAIEISTIMNARKLFDSIAAEVYSTSYIRPHPTDKTMLIRRKLDFHWTKKECEQKAPAILASLLNQVDPYLTPKQLKAMKPAEAIRAILKDELGQPEVKEYMSGNRLFMSQEVISYF